MILKITNATLSVSHTESLYESLVIMGHTAETKEYNFRLIK